MDSVQEFDGDNFDKNFLIEYIKNTNKEIKVNDIITKEIEDTTYGIEKTESGYSPSSINKGKITFANKPKTLVRRPSSNPFTSNIGPSNKGFTKMAGLGLILALFAIIIIVIINRI